MREIDPTSLRSCDLAAAARAEVVELLDLQLSPLGCRAIEALAPNRGEVVLDIGCGAGQSVLQLADMVGPSGKVIGVDIAPSLLDLARRRAQGRSHVGFIEGDAMTLDLPTDSIDCLFSRFGVMAFRDPVAAFANFRRMLKASGRLAFVCWQSLEDNELDRLALRAAGLEDRLDPTPFGFADPDFVRATLAAAGFGEITIQAHDELVSSGGLDEMITVLLTVGALGKICRENPGLRAAAEAHVRAALAARQDQGRVALNAATWVVTARP
jgi:SAM-dependent methyltransferase